MTLASALFALQAGTCDASPARSAAGGTLDVSRSATWSASRGNALESSAKLDDANLARDCPRHRSIGDVRFPVFPHTLNEKCDPIEASTLSWSSSK
jgi:hypothetical protein